MIALLKLCYNNSSFNQREISMKIKNSIFALAVLTVFSTTASAEWLENLQKTRQALDIGRAIIGNNQQQQQQIPAHIPVVDSQNLPQPLQVVPVNNPYQQVQQPIYQNQQPVQQASAEVSREPGACPQHYPAGYPMLVGVEAEKQKRRAFYTCQSNYAVMLDPQTKTPLWVSERLVGAQQAGTKVERVDGFTPHPSLPKQVQASLADYRSSKLDRGHMAPAADMLTTQAMAESFYMSNMVPQVGPNMNRTIWADLEAMARKWSEARQDVQVVTGPIFEGNVAKMGNGQVWVPTSLYKVVLDLRTLESIAFIIPNQQIVTRKTKNLDSGNPQIPQTQAAYAVNCGGQCQLDHFIVPLRTVEQKTGLFFFPQINNPQRATTYNQSRMWHAR